MEDGEFANRDRRNVLLHRKTDGLNGRGGNGKNLPTTDLGAAHQGEPVSAGATSFHHEFANAFAPSNAFPEDEVIDDIHGFLSGLFVSDSPGEVNRMQKDLSRVRSLVRATRLP
jgi:hypothetical protein